MVGSQSKGPSHVEKSDKVVKLVPFQIKTLGKSEDLGVAYRGLANECRTMSYQVLTNVGPI